MKGLSEKYFEDKINNIKQLFINSYRYPFKLVVKPRKLLSSVSHKKGRLSPPGFNSPNNKKKYDLYLEPDSLGRMANWFGILIPLCLIIVSFYTYKNIFCYKTILSSVLFLFVYYSFLFGVYSIYFSYPIFYNNWSRNLECYADWFKKVPQEVHINKRDYEEGRFNWIGSKAKSKTSRERQPLHYSWYSGSSQKGVWLLAIESLVGDWESNGIGKAHTSLMVVFCPIWSSYLALIAVLIVCDIDLNELVKNLYIPVIVWLLCSIIYLLLISFFTTERRSNEVRTNNSIVKFIPYELRSSAPRYNQLYSRFQAKHFIVLSNGLFAGLFIFFITLIGLIK